MAKLTGKDFENIFKEYAVNAKWLNDVELEIVGGESEVDPLVLLRIYDEKTSVDNNMQLAQGFCLNKTVRFFRKGVMLKEFYFDGSTALSEHFKDSPYLLDVLLKASFGLLLKKLTPPSEDSASNGNQ